MDVALDGVAVAALGERCSCGCGRDVDAGEAADDEVLPVVTTRGKVLTGEVLVEGVSRSGCCSCCCMANRKS